MASQQSWTDQWVLWSHAGFKGPVTKAELCHSFQTGDLEGDMLIYHVSQKIADAKEMAVYYEQWGPHMPASRRLWRKGHCCGASRGYDALIAASHRSSTKRKRQTPTLRAIEDSMHCSFLHPKVSSCD
ncbi:hypothetical protein WJX82_001395 [Trebouxia sp. C0006]